MPNRRRDPTCRTGLRNQTRRLQQCPLSSGLLPSSSCWGTTSRPSLIIFIPCVDETDLRVNLSMNIVKILHTAAFFPLLGRANRPPRKRRCEARLAVGWDRLQKKETQLLFLPCRTVFFVQSKPEPTVINATCYCTNEHSNGFVRSGTVGIPAQVPEKCKAEPQAIDAPPRLCEPSSNKRRQDSHRRRHPPSESP